MRKSHYSQKGKRQGAEIYTQKLHNLPNCNKTMKVFFNPEVWKLQCIMDYPQVLSTGLGPGSGDVNGCARPHLLGSLPIPRGPSVLSVSRDAWQTMIKGGHKCKFCSFGASSYPAMRANLGLCQGAMEFY